MTIDEIRKENKLTDLFCELATTPSPTLSEDKVAEKIVKILTENGIEAHRDSYGNVIGKLGATDLTKRPMLLSAHMDVVGDDSPVNIRLNGDIIETDKTRTLGADDKAGVSGAMMLAIELAHDKTIKHGGLELVFTRDEEQGMTGVKNVDLKQLNSEYALVIDADKFGQFQIAGASYTKAEVFVHAKLGGHSGIDIADKDRLNAAKLIAELALSIPQGVYKQDEYGVVTSINLGAIVGGGIQAPINRLKTSDVPSKDYNKFMIENAVTNMINTEAGLAYSIRSSNKEFEDNLISDIQKIVDDFNKKYEPLASAQLKTECHMKAFEKSEDETMIDLARKVGGKLGVPLDISSFHAGAETHYYANNTNAKGQKFKPYLVGIADIENMHSPNETMNYKSHLKGYEFLKELFLEFNR